MRKERKTSTNGQDSASKNFSKHKNIAVNEFIVRNKKQVTEEVEGGHGIPFSALKEKFRYKAYITNLSPNSNIESIKRHIDLKLGVYTSIKTVSPTDASYLSVILMFTSEESTLDLRMAGLWPKGTVVLECKPPKHRKKNNRTNHSSTSGYNNQQRHGQNSRSTSPRNQDARNRFPYGSQNRQHLREQWID